MAASRVTKRTRYPGIYRLHRRGCAGTDGNSPSTIQNTLNPLQVICRRAVRDDELAVDPTDGLELPAIRGRRERIADPAEAARLIDVLPAASARCGRRRSTPDSAAGSCGRSAGRTSTWRRA